MYRYRLIFAKEGEFAFLSHLDLQRTFIRALRRAGVPLAYSQGYNPQPRLSFAAPLAVGIESSGEYLELDLTGCWESTELAAALNRQLPQELAVSGVQAVDPHAPFLTSLVEASLYLVTVSPPAPGLSAAVQALETSSRLEVEREGKKAKKRIDIKPFIYNLHLINDSVKDKLFLFLASGNQGGVRPAEILALLSVPFYDKLLRIRRLAIFIPGPEGLITPAGETPCTYLPANL